MKRKIYRIGVLIFAFAFLFGGTVYATGEEEMNPAVENNTEEGGEDQEIIPDVEEPSEDGESPGDTQTPSDENVESPEDMEELPIENEESSEEDTEEEENPDTELSEDEVEDPESEEDKDVNTVSIGGADAPKTLRLNLLKEPFGVTRNALSFSWENSFENGMAEQQAYHIVVSSRKKDYEAGRYVYDSGWVESTQNTSVQLDLSSVLQENELYYWQVQIRNTAGNVSAFSEAQAFSTEVGTQWETKNGIWGSSNQKTVFLRHRFERPTNVERAVVNVTATSTLASYQYVYNLYINGAEVGIGPARQNGGTLYYNTYDITEYLSEGNNVIGAICYSENTASFLCQLTYYMSDGTKKIVVNSGRNDGAWQVLNGDAALTGGSSQSIGTGYYKASQDNLNAEVYPDGWNTVGYSPAGWANTSLNTIPGSYVLQPAQIDSMKRYEVAPQSVTPKPDGSYLVDFGKEIVGSIGLNVTSGQGKTITLEYGEELDKNGNAKYRLNTGNIYQEKWRLRAGSQKLSGIGMKTFRYVTIRNLPFTLSVEQVKGYTIRQEFDDALSSFSSSNTVLNDLYNLSKYTSMITNQDVYVDTQSRERKPYEGDALITALNSYGYSPTSSSAKFSAEYLLDNTTWPAEYSLYNIMLVYENYLYTGDTRGLDTVYQKLKNKTLEQYYNASVGLMTEITSPAVQGQKIMVDWPTTEMDNYQKDSAYYNTVFNAVCAGGYESMGKIAQVLGYSGDAAYYQGLSDSIRQNMIAKLYNPDTGEFYDGLTQDGSVVNHSAQHATAYALAFGIYSEQSMADKMAESIAQDEETKMSVYGTYFLLQGLYESNHGDLARKIMSNPDSMLGAKSWAYMMYGQGATVTTESWNSVNKSNMSLCHPWGAAPGVMLPRGLFGIKPTEAGFDKFQIKLQPGGVAKASIQMPTLKGAIQVSYEMDGNGGIYCTAAVPANSEGILYIPNKNGSTQLVVNRTVVDGIQEEGYLTYTLGSGSYTISASTGLIPDQSEFSKTDVVSNACISGQWQKETTNGLRVGSENGAGIQALQFQMKNQKVSGNIEYTSYMQTYEWQDWVSVGTTSGLPGAGKRLEAFKIRLTGELAKQYDIYYRAYVGGYGWLDWAQNGGTAGSSGIARELRAFEVKLLKKGEEAPGISARAYISSEKAIGYTTHVQTYGWRPESTDGEMSGTVGEKKRLEAIKISLKDKEVKSGVTYSAHVQSYGWQDWKSDGELAGTTGEAKRLEAVKIKLTGNLAQTYDIYYRVHAEKFGWLGWAKNGEPAGSEEYARRLEAIQICLVKKGDSAPGVVGDSFRKAGVAYKTHVQTYGWKSDVYDGELSGTEGQAKRLEGIRIQNKEKGIGGSIQYRTHVQTYGWESGWKSDGEMSGTEGLAKRLEAIQIRLTGELAEKYDVYYRVHIQSYGWLDWAKNGDSAGSEGLAKRLEAIEIRYVKKGGAAPGNMGNPFIK